MSEIRTHEQVVGIACTLAMEAHNDSEHEREEYGTRTRQAMRRPEATDAALRSEIARLTRERDEAREALAGFLNEPCEDCLGYEAQMSGMEDAYRDSERGRRDAEAEAKRMSHAAAENFDEAVAAQEAALAAEARAVAAEKERDEARDEARGRAASLSRELLAAIQARDSYRASAELRVGMRREFEELLGVGDTTAPETFEAGLVRLRALLAAERRAEEADEKAEGMQAAFNATLASERAAREKAEREFLATVFERDEEKLKTAHAEARAEKAERLAKALREIDAHTGHFGEAPPPPEWMPMLSLIAWVGKTARAALAEWKEKSNG